MALNILRNTQHKTCYGEDETETILLGKRVFTRKVYLLIYKFIQITIEGRLISPMS